MGGSVPKMLRRGWPMFSQLSPTSKTALRTLPQAVLILLAIIACTAPPSTQAPVATITPEPKATVTPKPSATPTALPTTTPTVTATACVPLAGTETPEPTATMTPTACVPLGTATRTPTATPTPTPLPPSVLLGSMNYQRQTLDNCGPTSVAILLGHYGHQVTQQQVNEHIPAGSVAGLGSYLSQYQLMARAYATSPSRDPVRHLLANRIPVIANQTLALDDDMRHYRVIRGYDDTSQEFISDDPLLGADLRIAYDTFIWLSSPGEIIPVYPPELDSLVQSLMGELGMEEVRI